MIDTEDKKNSEINMQLSLEELHLTLRELPNRFRDLDIRESQAYNAISHCHSERIRLQCMDKLLHLRIYQETS